MMKKELVNDLEKRIHLFENNYHVERTPGENISHKPGEATWQKRKGTSRGSLPGFTMVTRTEILVWIFTCIFVVSK